MYIIKLGDTMTSFEKKSIGYALERLYKDNVITQEQVEKLKEVYEDDPRSFNEVKAELDSLKQNKALYDQIISKKISNDLNTNIDIKKEEEKPKLSLENVNDFDKDGKSYIKIHYPLPDDSVKVIENNTDPFMNSKQIFEILERDYGIDASNTNAISNAFEQIINRFKEVKLYDKADMSGTYELKELPKEQKEIFDGVTKIIASHPEIYHDKKILVAPEESIVIIKTPGDPTADLIRKLQIVDGKYQLAPLDTKGYTYDEKTNDNSSASVGEENSISTEEETAYDNNNEEEIDREDELKKKTEGPVLTRKKKSMWANKKNAAFVNVLWISIFLGIITVVASFIVIIKLSKY